MATLCYSFSLFCYLFRRSAAPKPKIPGGKARRRRSEGPLQTPRLQVTGSHNILVFLQTSSVLGPGTWPIRPGLICYGSAPTSKPTQAAPSLEISRTSCWPGAPFADPHQNQKSGGQGAKAPVLLGTTVRAHFRCPGYNILVLLQTKQPQC